MPTAPPTQTPVSPPADDRPAVLLIGNVVDGIRHVGPFPDPEAANVYGDETVNNQEWCVADLEPVSAEFLAELAEEAAVALVGATLEPQGPISVLMLTDDWDDDPMLTEADRETLRATPQDVLVSAIEAEFSRYEDQWYSLLDAARSSITSALLATTNHN